jgi:hypothetical protein
MNGQPSSPGRCESGWRCGFLWAPDVELLIIGMVMDCLHTRSLYIPDTSAEVSQS